MPEDKILTLPNAICLLRLILAPVLLFLAWNGHGDLFILVLVAAFLLDALDGPLARYLHQESELGPRLDTTADVAIYMVLPVCIWWLWPDLIRREWVYVLLIITSILAPMTAGFIKFRRPTSYHTWLVKAAATVTAVSTLVMLLGGPELPFRIASFVCLAAGIEEILITLTMGSPKSNVRSLVHVLRNRQ
ncbi:MAG: CDP-alcohol phosphatidyltransferase family protein [Gammaproteobacteria bacterium]